MFVEVNLKKGEVLINEGESSNSIFVLRVGELAIYKYDKEAALHNLIGHVQAGELVGEMSFLDNLPRSATVKANTDCVLSLINRHDFDKLISSQDALVQTLVKTLSERLRKTNRKIHL